MELVSEGGSKVLEGDSGSILILTGTFAFKLSSSTYLLFLSTFSNERYLLIYFFHLLFQTTSSTFWSSTYLLFKRTVSTYLLSTLSTFSKFIFSSDYSRVA